MKKKENTSGSSDSPAPVSKKKDASRFKKIMALAIFLRLGYMFLNETIGIDTDIDYNIYTEAAEEFLIPSSLNPYNRYTYRYTPLLSFIMIPNLIWMPFGKLLFNIFDILALVYIKKYLDTVTWVTEKQKEFCLRFWAYNVYMIYINGRGSCESISLFLLMGMLFYLRDYNLKGSQSSLIKAALFYGMLVHFRLYPILYGLSVVLYITKGSLVPTVDAFKFFSYSAGLFAGLFLVFRILFGYVFAYEWALYHLVRKDPRHSQSVFWMRTMYRHKDGDFLPVNLVTLIFRLGVIIFVSFKYKKNIVYAIFIQTLIFTIFNTVYTAQYAIWEIQMLPLVLTQNGLYKRLWTLGLMLLGWFITMEVSIICGGLYEGGGKNTLKFIHYMNIVYVFYRVGFLKVVMGEAQPVSEF